MKAPEKTINDLIKETYVSDTMRWWDGPEVTVNLSWDRDYFYVGFGLADSSLDFFEEEEDGEEKIADYNLEMEAIGVHKFRTLEGANFFIAQYCGDDEPVVFEYTDDESSIYTKQWY